MKLLKFNLYSKDLFVYFYFSDDFCFYLPLHKSMKMLEAEYSFRKTCFVKFLLQNAAFSAVLWWEGLYSSLWLSVDETISGLLAKVIFSSHFLKIIYSVITSWFPLSSMFSLASLHILVSAYSSWFYTLCTLLSGFVLNWFVFPLHVDRIRQGRKLFLCPMCLLKVLSFLPWPKLLVAGVWACLLWVKHNFQFRSDMA